MFVFFDIGIKNFCYLICKLHNEKLEIIDFEIVSLTQPLIASTIFLLDKITSLPDIEKYFIELQNYRNVKCIKIETAIETYLRINRLYFAKVHPFKKLKSLGIFSSSYFIRKKRVVEHGEKFLTHVVLSQKVSSKLSELKKKDDFFDCFLMAITEITDIKNDPIP